MSESKKALLGGLIFLAAIGALGAWVTQNIEINATVWTLRIGLPIVVLVAGALLAWAHFRKDIAPDLIRQLVTRKPFERNGVNFAILPMSKDGFAYLNIVFQNQYERPCDFRVMVSPPLKSFSFENRHFDGITLDIQCEGGVFGVVRAALGVPEKFQHAKTRFDVAAATRYKAGRGSLLRFRNGLRVGKTTSSDLGSAAVAVTLAMTGHVHCKKPASIRITLPSAVAEAVPSSQSPLISILWTPAEPAEDVAEMLKAVLAGV